MKRISCSLVILLVAGCGSIHVPQTSFYRLRLPEPTGGVALPGGRLGIGRTTLASDLAGDQLVVRDGAVKLSHYRFHQWAGSLDAMLGDAITAGLSRSGCFEDVFPDAIANEVDYVLDTHVRGFHLVVEDGEWFGEATMEFRLSTPDGVTLFRQERSARNRAVNGEPEAVVQALSTSVEALVAGLLGECEQRGLFARSPAAEPAR
ncbi:MAG: membrane integrity-associated transporter subunit PqiC [Planctomycetes bacterium]|nr:membrane integrity-associated transporter subunit PqiC [Planctomycetota bacterium]